MSIRLGSRLIFSIKNIDPGVIAIGESAAVLINEDFDVLRPHGWAADLVTQFVNDAIAIQGTVILVRAFAVPSPIRRACPGVPDSCLHR